jgi:hypothetical protein
MDPVTGRSLKTVIAFTDDTRFFSGIAVSSTCPYEGRIAYNFLEKLGTDEQYDIKNEKYYSRELVSYFIGNICDRIEPRPKSIGIVIPKWWDDWMKQDLIDAAKIADVELFPIPSNFAHALAFYEKISMNEGDQKFIGLVDAGATGFDITFSKIKKNKIETILYKHFDFGGEDLTVAIANEILRRALEQNKNDSEVRKLLENIRDRKDMSQYRIFFKEAERTKESLSPGITTRFDPKALKHEVRVEIRYEEILEIKEIKEYYTSMIENLKKVKREYEKITNNKPYCFDINGGSGIFNMIKDIVSTAFEGYKLTNFLTAKESIASGAASFKKMKENGMKFVDNVKVYDLKIDNGKLIQVPNRNVLISIPHPSSNNTYEHIPKKFKEIEIALTTRSKQSRFEFDNFGMVITKYLIHQTKDEKFIKEKQRYDEHRNRDIYYTKLGELINQFQAQTIELESFKNSVTRDFNKEEEQEWGTKIINISKEYQQLYKDKNSTKDKEEIQKYINEIFNKTTRFVLDFMEHYIKEFKENVQILKPDDSDEEFSRMKVLSEKQKTSLDNAIKFGEIFAPSESSQNWSKIMKCDDITKYTNTLRKMRDEVSKINGYNMFIQLSKIEKKSNDHTTVLKPLSKEKKDALLDFY